MEKKIRFKDLSFWLKVAIIFSWIIGLFFSITFITGFMIGIIGG